MIKFNVYLTFYRSNSDPDSTKKPSSSPLLDGNTFAAFKNSGLDRACSMKTGVFKLVNNDLTKSYFIFI